jgi:hypothetical protein
MGVTPTISSTIKKHRRSDAFLSFLSLMVFNGCFHQSYKQGVWTVRAALEFRMGLGSFEVGMILQFDGFYEAAIGWMPMERSSFTECWVGLDFSSSAASM